MSDHGNARVQRVLLVRHGESEFSRRGIVNGDPHVAGGLTPCGIRQSEALGGALHAEAVGLAVTSDFDRCRLTAQIALSERPVRWLELSSLGDIRCGSFEGCAIAEYRRWAHAAPASEAAPGEGESRAAAAKRIAAGVRTVLEQPEQVALVVSHQFTIAYLLRAIRGERPVRRVEAVPHATIFPVSGDALSRAASVLDSWSDEPDW